MGRVAPSRLPVLRRARLRSSYSVSTLADYRGRLADIPFDFHELLGALAPRAVFINAPLEDSNFKAHSVDEVAKVASAVYRLYGAEKNLQVVHPPGGHDFPDAVREQAYQLLEEKLR